jgi:hypothetical protein
MWLTILLSFFALTQSTIVSNTGCTCALTKGTLTTPNASSTIAVGCSLKTDWNTQNTEWCLTDQSNQQCGTYQPGFGYVDSCDMASFSNIQIQEASMIEWDQTPTTFYTGQTINITWDYSNIGVDEWVRIQYQGTGGTRTLTTGSGTNITNKQYSVRLSDSSNGLTAGDVPVTLNLPSTTAITNNSLQSITVLQSKLMNIIPLDGNRTLGGGQNTVCDNRNLTIRWRGLGEAQFGLASITLRRQNGFFGTQTLISSTNIPIFGNVSIDLVCPRTTTPSSSNAYAFEISVQEPGGSAYTGTSASFNVATAPTPSNTPTPSPTPSKTPTSSPSNTPSNSPTPSVSPSSTPTPSVTPSQTPTGTPSQTPTISTTPTANPSLDLVAIARSAASAVDTQTPAIAGALGGIGGVLLLLGGFKWYQQKVMTEKRKRKLAASARWVQDAHKAYGVESISSDPNEPKAQPSIVMYTVQNMPPRSHVKKGFTPVSSKGTSV